MADAIVVAAGNSARMGGTDKLVATIEGRPLLAWTLDALHASPDVDRIVIATAADRVAALAEAPWLPTKVIAVVAGGTRRQASVAAGVGAARLGSERRAISLSNSATRARCRPRTPSTCSKPGRSGRVTNASVPASYPRSITSGTGDCSQ